MKRLLFISILAISQFVSAQNVGINQNNPTHSLHVSPVNPTDDPIKIDGIKAYSVGDTSLLVIDNATGVVRYITIADFVAAYGGGGGTGTDNQNLDSLVLNNLILSAYIESGNSASVDLSAIKDSSIQYLINHADTLLYNPTFVSSIVDSASQDISLNGTLLSVSGGSTVDLQNIATPAGAVFAFPVETPPTGYLACNGQAVSRTTYANLFSLIGTRYGAGDGSTTFNLPDYNGQFLRGWDNGSGVDVDASTRLDRGDGTTGDFVGTKQNGEVTSHTHMVDPPSTNTNTTGAHTHSVDPPSTNTNTTGAHTHSIDPPNTSTTSVGSHTHSVNPPNTNTTGGGSHNHTGQTGGIVNYSSSTWVPYDDNLSSDLVNEYNGTPSICGQSWNGNGTVGNFMGKLNSSCLYHTHSISTDGYHSHSVNIPAFTSGSAGAHSHSVNIPSFNSSSAGSHSHSVDISSFNSGSAGNHSHSVDISSFSSSSYGGGETRPTNVSVLWCIKY